VEMAEIALSITMEWKTEIENTANTVKANIRHENI